MPKARRGRGDAQRTPTWVVEELFAEAVVRPTLGAARYAECLEARGFVISPSGVQKLLNRSGLGRRRQRVAALAQLTAATTGLVTEPALEGPFGFCHFAARPGDLVALDSFFIGKLKGVGAVWQLTAVDTATRWAICEVFIGPSTAKTAAGFVDRVIRKLKRLGVTVTGVLSDNGPEFTGKDFTRHIAELGSRITAPRPAPRTTTRSVNASKAPRSKNAGVPRSIGDASTGSPSYEPRSTPGSSPTTPADPTDPTSSAAAHPVRSSTTTAKRGSMTIIHTAHLSPRPVARKA